MRTYPEHQGKGYGRKIMAELVRRAKEYGYKTLILETSDRQNVAINLYKSAGFREERRETIDGFNCIWFSMRL
jgi:ribosomal protein S18 acetylase RimI-like enzyme